MRSLGRRLRLSVGAAQLMPRSASTGELGRHQSSDPDEVVRSGDQVASQLGPRQAAKARPTEATHGLHPAKDLLYSLAEALAYSVAGVACRSTIDGTPPPSRVLRHVGRHPALAQLGHTLAGVIVLVPSQCRRMEAAFTRFVHQVHSRVAFGGAGGQREFETDDESVAVLHEHMPGIRQMGFFPLALLGQARFGIGGALVRGVGPLLAME